MQQESEEALDGEKALERASTALERRAWDRACAELAAADEQGVLRHPKDLERLAVSARLTGREELAETAWTRAHDGYRDRGEIQAAVRCAFWLGMVLVLSGSAEARGGGWIARAHRLLEEQGPRDCPEWGYVLLPEALQALGGGDPGVAHVAFSEAASIGQQYADLDLVTLARLGQGQALIRMGEARRGTGLLDEAMLAVGTGQVSALTAGIVYCAVLAACHQLYDVRRAQEWTEAFSRWCDAQSGLVLFRGQCLVHRSQLSQLRGDLTGAVVECDRACRWLSDPPDPAVGMAYYQRAELHRTLGQYAAAELAYQDAADHGHDPHPGLALLWLAQGRTGAAVGAIRRVVEERSRPFPTVVDELHNPRPRAEALAACVEIVLRAGDVEAADRACAELGRISHTVGTRFMEALARRTRGQVLLAQGRPGPALEELTRACGLWLELQAPHEAARTRMLASRALHDLGDEETAALEERAAKRLLAGTGAELDVAPPATTTAQDVPGLTARELDVVRLVAAGCTNREIGVRLVISDKTVARHLHNVLTKLSLPNRSAVTAYAYEHRLV